MVMLHNSILQTETSSPSLFDATRRCHQGFLSKFMDRVWSNVELLYRCIMHGYQSSTSIMASKILPLGIKVVVLGGYVKVKEIFLFSSYYVGAFNILTILRY